MELKGSKTEANLLAAFASKAHQKNMYDSYAYRFAYSGHQHIQNATYDAAKLEGTHARILYELLYGPIPETKANVRMLLEDETRMGKELYECAQVAREEGFEEAAACFEETARINDYHMKILEQFLYNLEHDRVFYKDVKADWVCVACGYVVHDRSLPETCPYCEHPKGLLFIRPSFF